MEKITVTSPYPWDKFYKVRLMGSDYLVTSKPDQTCLLWATYLCAGMADSVRGPTLLELRDLVQAGILMRSPDRIVISLGAGGHQQHGLHRHPQVSGRPRGHPGHRPPARQVQTLHPGQSCRGVTLSLSV